MASAPDSLLVQLSKPSTPTPSKGQDLPVGETLAHLLHHGRMLQLAETRLDIHLEYPVIITGAPRVDLGDRVLPDVWAGSRN